jgi:hypothetical protein
MGVMLKSLQLAFQRGKAIAPILDDVLISVLADQLETIRELIRQIPLEANPGTATYTLPEWHEALGQKYNPTLPIADQRIRLEAQRLAIGGMTLYQLQEQVNKEFPGITVSEVSATAESGVAESGVMRSGGVEGDYSPTYYDVAGTLDNDEQVKRLAAILERYAAAHLVPCSSIIVLGATATAESGVGLSGMIESGYIPD